MMNYLKLDDKHIQMAYGIMGGITSFRVYPSGELESVNLGDYNMVVTHAGELKPAYTTNSRRKQKPSITFHKNGIIKAVSLEEQTEIETPIGTLPVEYVTFYDSGEIHRVFVADGQISGFWSEEEEKEYSIPLTFEFDFAKFTARLNGLCFYKSGAIKSVTLYPGEEIELQTPAGKLKTTIGFSLYENGELESVEPSKEVLINTAIGMFLASDETAIGVNADSNSMKFDEKGRLASFKTSAHRIVVTTNEGAFKVFMPTEVAHPLLDEATMLLPMEVAFDFEKDTVTLKTNETGEFSMEKDKFVINELPKEGPGCSPLDCATCSICNN